MWFIGVVSNIVLNIPIIGDCVVYLLYVILVLAIAIRVIRALPWTPSVAIWCYIRPRHYKQTNWFEIRATSTKMPANNMLSLTKQNRLVTDAVYIHLSFYFFNWSLERRKAPFKYYQYSLKRLNTLLRSLVLFVSLYQMFEYSSVELRSISDQNGAIISAPLKGDVYQGLYQQYPPLNVTYPFEPSCKRKEMVKTMEYAMLVSWEILVKYLRRFSGSPTTSIETYIWVWRPGNNRHIYLWTWGHQRLIHTWTSVRHVVYLELR